MTVLRRTGAAAALGCALLLAGCAADSEPTAPGPPGSPSQTDAEDVPQEATGS